MKTQSLIHEFLMQRRIAVAGVSRNPDEFSQQLFKEFLRRGYDLQPVHPEASTICDMKCVARVQDVSPPVTTALVFPPKGELENILLDCAEAGITLVWIYGISGASAVPPEALNICEEHGIGVIAGFCPFMFLPKAAWYHRLHGTVWKMIGRYPH